METAVTTTSPLLTPQIVGQAENAHKPLIGRILGPTGTTMHQWVALTMTATAGGAIEAEQLAAQMVGALKIDHAAAHDTIAELVAARLLADEAPQVGFTDAGRAKHGQIRAAVDAIIAQVYGDIPTQDLATAARVLMTITDRLNTV
jgi:DNA-binding MarR family transcriptional regulator